MSRHAAIFTALLALIAAACADAPDVADIGLSDDLGLSDDNLQTVVGSE